MRGKKWRLRGELAVEAGLQPPVCFRVLNATQNYFLLAFLEWMKSNLLWRKLF